MRKSFRYSTKEDDIGRAAAMEGKNAANFNKLLRQRQRTEAENALKTRAVADAAKILLSFCNNSVDKRI